MLQSCLYFCNRSTPLERRRPAGTHWEKCPTAGGTPGAPRGMNGYVFLAFSIGRPNFCHQKIVELEVRLPYNHMHGTWHD